MLLALSEVNVVSGFLNASPNDVLNRLKELGMSVVNSYERALSEARVITIEFKTPRGMEYAAIGKNLIACTSTAILRGLETKLDAHPGIFNWARGLCPSHCQWLMKPPDGVVIRGCFLRSRTGDSVCLFDSSKEKWRSDYLTALEALLKRSQGYEDGHLLTSIAFSQLGDLVEQIIVDFDGFVTLKGNSKQGNKWIPEALEQYLRICSETGSEIETHPENKPGIPKWMIDIYMERRWDKER